MKSPSSSKNNSNGKNINLNDDAFDLNNDGGFDLNVVGTSYDDNSSENNDIKCVIDLNLEADFDESKDLSPKTESLGQKTENLGQKTKTFGSNNGSLGEKTETFGQNSVSLGEKTKNCGPNIGSLGKNMEICGTNIGSLGENMEICGPNSGSLGEKTETCGAITESLGEKAKTIGPNIGSLGENIVSKIECLGEKTKRGFDLNMGFLDEVDNNGKMGEDGCLDDKKVGDCLNKIGKENNGFSSGIGSNGDVTVVHEDESKDNGSSPVCDEIEKSVKTVKRRKRGVDEIGKREGIASGVVSTGEIKPEDCSKDCSDIPVSDDFATPRTEKTVKRRKKVADSGNSSIEMTLRRSSRRLAKGGCSSAKIAEYVNDDLENDVMLDSGSTVKRRKRRKKIEVLENGNSEMKTLSRRTSRRLMSSLSVDNGSQSSIGVGVKLEERFTTTGCQQSEEYSVLPPKLKLPTSSGNLDLDGVSVLSVFSVYTCLRSFSTLLFLSPFSVEDFAAALKYNVANMLFDSIHVSLLQKLKKHMEFLSDENIPSAANCLRNLNWDLLDSITWPIFMVDYLLIHGSALNDGLDLPKLKLFESEYYKQPAGVKIEILRSLCDDVMEAEAIRLELNRRTLATDPNMDVDRNFKSERSKRGKTSFGALGGSCLTEEVADEIIDCNSDECCLCKMDGSLICCDGCPAAYHMKCVGVSSDTLPDGDWYCPECSVDKGKPWLKMGKSFRGAEILGVDPHGVVYYLSAGYLLVLDSCDSESSCCYYHGNDLTPIIEALLASGPRYEPIVDAISKHLSIFASHSESKSKTDSHNADLCSGKKEQTSLPSALPQHVAPLKPCTGDESLNKKDPEENSVAAQHSGSTECDHLDKSARIENLLSSSEGSVETSQTPGVQKLPVAGSDIIKNSIASSNGSGTLDTTLTMRDVSLTSANLGGELENSIQPSPMTKGKLGDGLQRQPKIRYINCYSFAHTSSMVADELTRRSVEKLTESSSKSAEHMISTQLKAASKSSTKFSWPMYHGADARKEICGWCFACRAAEDDGGSSDCIFKVKVSNLQGFGNELASLYLQQSLESHVVDVLGYMLYMEDRLRGLLLGPWVNPHYSEIWRRSVVKASYVASLKQFLLLLEANMHRLAIAPDWNKHVDYVTTMGSASHIVTSSSRMSSKHGFGRKRVRGLGEEPKPSLKKMSGLGILWWRGGRLSRELFSWKVLPHALASKAARQAGCQMVPGLLYPESTDFTKRSRSIVWKAAVELSSSVEQLALQVRELDANIRWDDIENTHLLAKTDQYKKSVRSFKKVIIRKKLTEGTIVKYLLDFGKRRFIPDIVLTHGSMVEETSSERKKYWLEDTHVPLHLLKIFEERRVARKTSKINSVKHHPSDKLTKRTPKIKGLPYLFARAEESKYYLCGQCNKDVLISVAVCCIFCKDFFHKRHVKKSPVATASEITYSCHKCRDGKIAKFVNKKGKKVVSYKSVGSRVLRSNAKKKVGKDTKPAMKQKNKKSNAVVVLPLRRSPRILTVATVQKRKVGRPKKGKGKSKQIKTTKDVQKQPKKSTWQKKRTQTAPAYWLNGIRFSRKQHDERVVVFKGKSLIIPSCRPSVSMPSPPKCSLSCEKDFTPSLSYVSCEICEDWFHGDAFGLSVDIMDSIIGFRCHKCRDMTSPVCPNLHKKTNDKTKSGEVNGDQELKNSSFGDRSSCKDQELGNLASNVDNIKLPDSEEERRGAVENSKDVDNIPSSIPIPIPTSCQSNVENIKLPDSEEGRTEAVGYCKNVDDSIAYNTTVAMDVD